MVTEAWHELKSIVKLMCQSPFSVLTYVRKDYKGNECERGIRVENHLFMMEACIDAVHSLC